MVSATYAWMDGYNKDIWLLCVKSNIMITI